MADYTASVTYQTVTPQVTGSTQTEPTLATLNVKITGGAVAENDVLRIFVTTTITGFETLSWQHTVGASDDFTTNGVDFTLSGEIKLAIGATTPTFSDGKVYKGADWGFTAA